MFSITHKIHDEKTCIKSGSGRWCASHPDYENNVQTNQQKNNLNVLDIYILGILKCSVIPCS